jgi:outer membrane murein-binding lipoprotein Lpp
MEAAKRIISQDVPKGLKRVKSKENAMTWIVKACKNLTMVIVLFAFLAVSGCEGTDTREQVDDTVEELAGKKEIDQMDQMKKDINKAAQQQAERFKKTDESAAEK